MTRDTKTMATKTLSNWSDNKVVKAATVYEPGSLAKLKDIIKTNADQKIRVVGSNMSPSGIAMSDQTVVISMAKFN